MIAAVLAGILLQGAALPVHAGEAPASCVFPDDLALTDMRLPAARNAVSDAHTLSVLTVGGSSTAGLAARGPEFSYPSRLAVHLRAALPGVTVTLTNRGQPAGSTRSRVDRLQTDLAELKPDLVIWAPGSSEAGMSEDPDNFVESLREGLDKIHTAGADVIFIDLQYAPSIARVLNLAQYNGAIAGVAGEADVPLLRRSELMRRWNDDGTFDLDNTPPSQRVPAIRRLFDCIAKGLATGIAQAVAPKPAP